MSLVDGSNDVNRGYTWVFGFHYSTVFNFRLLFGPHIYVRPPYFIGLFLSAFFLKTFFIILRHFASYFLICFQPTNKLLLLCFDVMFCHEVLL